MEHKMMGNVKRWEDRSMDYWEQMELAAFVADIEEK